MALVWVPEVVSELRASWKRGQDWDRTIALREKLQLTLDAVVNERRRSRPKTTRACSHCGGEMRPAITVRALILALDRFQIESQETVSALDKAWVKHRAAHKLDGFGREKGPKVAATHVTHASSS